MAFNDKPEQNKQPSIGGGFNKPASLAPKQQGQFSAPKPQLNRQGAKPLSGSKIQPGSPKLNTPNPSTHTSAPVGVIKKPFETKKGLEKRLNKTFVETGQPTLGVWKGIPRDPRDNRPDQIKFNPAFNKTNEIRQKMAKQGFSPATKPATQYKWSEGLSDDDNARVNKALNTVAGFAGHKDLSKVNKDWVQDLGYQLKNDGASEEDIQRLSDHFSQHAPTYEEVYPESKKEQNNGPAHDHIIGFTGNTDDIEGMQSIIDNQLQKYGRIGGGMYDDLDQAGFYLDANNKVQRKVPLENNGKIPDTEIDEDYERSWGPQGEDEEEDSQTKEVDYSGYDPYSLATKSKMIGEAINAGSEQYGDGPYVDGDRMIGIFQNPEDGKFWAMSWGETESSGGPLSDSEEIISGGFDSQEDLMNKLRQDGYLPSEEQERAQASKLFGTKL